MIIAMPRTLQTDRTHDGKLFQVDVLSWMDETGRRIVREVVRHPGAVLVLALLDGERVIMIRNHRVAVDQTLWELPAGKLEPDEPPASAARRELEEETGYRAGRVRLLGEFYTSPGFADELMRVYLAEGLTATAQRLEPGEEITVEPVELSRALEMIRNGEIRDGKTVAALLQYWTFERNREA